ncbi:MAG TPA: DNA-binding protein [Methanosarcinales archaeon]|nr:DNA-binding protein [Methanosarcinales archaeon]
MHDTEYHSILNTHSVIIDTNGLMIPVQFNVDIFSELHRLGYNEFIVPSAVVQELKRLLHKHEIKGKDKIAVKVALSLLDRCKILSTKNIKTDEVILKIAKKYKSAVLTNDINLKKKLIKEGINVVILRQKNRLEKV